MNTAPEKTEILGLERMYWDAMKNNDVESAISLTKFPCTISGPQGTRRVSEKEYRKLMSSMKGDCYEGVQIENPEVDVLGTDTALISYSTQVKGMKMLDISTWVRDGGKWVCAFHAENPMQQ